MVRIVDGNIVRDDAPTSSTTRRLGPQTVHNTPAAVSTPSRREISGGGSARGGSSAIGLSLASLEAQLGLTGQKLLIPAVPAFGWRRPTPIPMLVAYAAAGTLGVIFLFGRSSGTLLRVAIAIALALSLYVQMQQVAGLGAPIQPKPPRQGSTGVSASRSWGEAGHTTKSN